MLPGGPERRWLRPLGLFGVVVALSVGHPLLVVMVAFGLLTLLSPGARVVSVLATATALGLAFVGEPDGALWYMERGWAILVGGWFAVMISVWPASPVLLPAMAAVVGALVSAWFLLSSIGGLEVAEWYVAERIRGGLEASLRLLEGVWGAEVASATSEGLGGIGEVQLVVLPALLGLSALAALGVAWWMHIRITTGSKDALGSFPEFRFPDPMIWVMIAGLGLMLAGDWSVGWGRVGTNLAAFMGGLYTFRGVAVALALVGRMSFLRVLALMVGVVFAGPFLLAAAMVVGVSDSWFDLRSRAVRSGDGGTG